MSAHLPPVAMKLLVYSDQAQFQCQLGGNGKRPDDLNYQFERIHILNASIQDEAPYAYYYIISYYIDYEEDVCGCAQAQETGILAPLRCLCSSWIRTAITRMSLIALAHFHFHNCHFLCTNQNILSDDCMLVCDLPQAAFQTHSDDVDAMARMAYEDARDPLKTSQHCQRHFRAQSTTM